MNFNIRIEKKKLKNQKKRWVHK